MLIRFACLVALSFIIAATHGGMFDSLLHPQTTATVEDLMGSEPMPAVDMVSVLDSYR